MDVSTDDLDELIHSYFADSVILAAQTARLLETHEQIPVGRTDGYDGRLFDWLVEMLNYGPPDGAEQAWPIIIRLISEAPNDRALGFVGSSALEDLVNKHGAEFLDRFLEHAANEPRLLLAMGFVWYRDDVPEALKELIDRHRPGG